MPVLGPRPPRQLLSGAASVLARSAGGGVSQSISSLAGATLRGGAAATRVVPALGELQAMAQALERFRLAPGKAFGLRLDGLSLTGRGLEQIARGVSEASTTGIMVTSDLPYAFGINYGYRVSGRLARRAGGTFSLIGALFAVTPLIAPRLAQAIPDGPAAVRGAMLGLGRRLVNETRSREVVVTGRLRDSYYTVVA